MTTETYKTFKFYDNQGRRLSIYGVDNKETKEIQITVIHCSKHDTFIKKEGDRLFRTGEHKPETYTLPYSEKPKKAFLHFCRNQYNLIVPYKMEVKYKLVNAADYIDNQKEIF